MTLQDLLNKTCLIGITYLTSEGDVLKQAQYAGTVVTADQEEGISVQLMALPNQATDKAAIFKLPSDLSPWFVAPAGEFKNAQHNIDIKDPDYLVTWDVVRKKDDTKEGKFEWWEWQPRVTPPVVN